MVHSTFSRVTISSLDTHASHASGGSSLLSPGRRVFQRYLLQRLVGRGGMGVVWLAQDEKLDRPVALKFLPEVLFLDPAARDDLKRETRRSLDLTHPHIVRIHDFVEDEETAAIAMEYVDGPTLSQLRVDRASRVFEIADLKIWTAALCAALDYAHEAGRCVHRDLKPSNLMVNGRGVLKVADFGIACGLHHTAARVSALSSTGGTLGYMSPQQLLGELASPADDIYSLGATLYELLTGKPPFYSGDISAQIRDVRPETIAARRAGIGLPGDLITPAWEETIAACLAKDARDRPRRARDVARGLGLPLAGATEISPDLGEELPPTLRIPSAELLRGARPARIGPQCRKIAQLASRYRWPVITFLTFVAAVIPWFVRVHPAPTDALPTPAATPSPAIAAAPVPVSAPAPAPTVATSEAPVPPSAPITDRGFLTAPAVAAAPPATPAAEEPARLEINSIPAGIPFQIFGSAYETPNPQVLGSGETPATVENLAPGAYRISFAAPGLPPRSASVQMPDRGTTRFQQDFPHGSLKVSSQPAGAEIFCNDRLLGQTPLTVDLLAGSHQIGARWQDRQARVRTVTLGADASETVAFDFRSTTATRNRSRRPAKKEDDSMWEKMGRSITKIFTPEKGGKGK